MGYWRTFRFLTLLFEECCYHLRMTKHCGGCNKNLSTENFSVAKNESSGFQSQCKNCMYKKSVIWKRLNAEKSKFHQTEFHRKLRKAAIEHLGSKCVRCGFNDIRALVVDHVLSDGADERRKNNQQKVLKIVIASVPGERYQCLCANCNSIVRWERGEHGKRPPTTAAA